MGQYLDVGKKGVHFQDVEEKIYREYRKKGYSPEKAREIARKTAGKVFWHKFGKRQGAKIISKAKKIARAKKDHKRGGRTARLTRR